MKISRIHSDATGETHLDEIEVPLADAGPIGRLSRPLPAAGLILRENDPGYDYDWHRAPQRQYVVMLDGEIEVEVSDGGRRRFAAGDVFLVEDVTGRGHRTRLLTPGPRRSLFVTAGAPRA